MLPCRALCEVARALPQERARPPLVAAPGGDGADDARRAHVHGGEGALELLEDEGRRRRRVVAPSTGGESGNDGTYLKKKRESVRELDFFDHLSSALL